MMVSDMNRLELVQRLALEATRSAGPSTTIGQTYENGRFVKWIDTAYEDIQNLTQTWNFLRDDFSFNTIASVQNYTSDSIPLAELGTWDEDSFKSYLTSSGVNGEIELSYIPWEEFRRIYMLGANQSTEGMPVYFTIKPDNSVSFWPVPDDEYTISGEYWKRAQVMDANDDEPLIPQQFQMIIVWKALMYYGHDAPAPEKYTAGEANYQRMLQKLELHQLPKIQLGGPLI